MPLRPLYGHERLRNRLVGALASGRLPQALLFAGPEGVGKQRLALWLAQAIVCQSRGDGEPCATCQACRWVDTLQHPDVHWFVPLLRQDASDPDKAVEKTEEALLEILAERRTGVAWGPPDGLAAHHLAAVRLLLRRLYLKPAVGQRKVFVVGQAERLVPQESSPEAANALLKALEEPPADTTLLLTTAEPGALLPTVRSRLVAVRVGPLPDAVVGDYLRRELDPAPTAAEIQRRVAVAGGSIGRALADEDQQAAAEAARRLVAAAAGGPGRRAATALAQPPWSARGEFTTTLDAVAWTLRERLRQAIDAADPASRPLMLALDAVAEARQLAQGNVNPQLILADLTDRLAEVA